ncbi:MAG TPA: hypothetical protein VFI29_18590 [Hanamia sp.]|nr:hypothetical protein [Hanamia sp.]
MAVTCLPAICTPLYRQHEPDTGFEREHGRSGEERRSNTLPSPEVGRSHSSEEVFVTEMERRASVVHLY